MVGWSSVGSNVGSGGVSSCGGGGGGGGDGACLARMRLGYIYCKNVISRG